MKCKHCGEEIDNDSNFCEYCGESVNNNVAEIEKKGLKSNAKNYWWCALCLVAVGILYCADVAGFGTVSIMGVALLLAVGLLLYYIVLRNNNKDRSLYKK